MKLKVGAKLGLTFTVVLVLMLLSTILVYLKATRINETQALVSTVRVPSVMALTALQRDLNQVGAKTRQAILASNNKEHFDKAKALFDDFQAAVNKDLSQLDELAPRWTVQANRERLAALKPDISQFLKINEDSIAFSRSGGKDAMVQAGDMFNEKGIAVNSLVQKTLGELSNSHTELMKGAQVQIDSDVKSMIWMLWISTLLAIAVAAAVGIVLSRGISKSASACLGQAEAIASGDLRGQELVVTSRDELGDLTKAINQMHSNLRNIVQSIAENSQNVANASEEFSAVSQQISANSEETSAQASAVSAATEEVNRNLQTVATATEEMSASIQEIAKNATEAAKVAGEAMKTAAHTNTIVGKLGESSAEIGQVIKVITSIAQKTDLLALNATVEAARAGEVGAGFAVVANEVKELAKQTATATEDISKKIEAIQIDAKGAVEAIKAISGIIDQVNQISSTIATAVEEQSATTSEMSRNLTEAAKGSGEVAQNINGVAQAAQNTSHGATDSQKAAKSLAEMSTQLRELVSQFKVDDRGSGNGSRPTRSSGTARREAQPQHEPEASFTR